MQSIPSLDSAKTGSGTLGRLVCSAIARFRDRQAMSDGHTEWTYRDLGEAIGRFISALRNRGLAKGDGIAVLSTNRVEAFALLCAANLLGVRYTPLHPLAAAAEHAFILEDSGAALLIVDTGFAERVGSLRQSLPGLEIAALGAVPGCPDILTELAGLAPAPLVDHADSEAIAYLAYTGGTTGRSKGVMLSHRSLVTMASIIAAEWEWPRLPRYAVVTPITHSGGINIYPVLHLGGYVRLMQGFKAANFCHVVEKERLNCTFLVPTLIGALLDDAGSRAAFDLSSLELIIYGAAPISPDRLREAIDTFGPIFLQHYGQTECPQCACTLRRADHDLSRIERLGSCGVPVPTMELKLFDEHMQEVEVGRPGEICVRGPLMMSGYWKQPDATAAVFAGGWLHTGDVAIRDSDGYIYIVDRTKDMIISGGFNIYPREVEDAIMSHPDVAQAAVIGVPDPKWGEAVKAFVVPRPGRTLNPAALMQHVKDKRGGPWTPKSVELVMEVPLTSLGKVDRKALRARYWQGESRSVS
ncbi:acyl-CoA synthetase [Aliidongia dinghuensis]|uniref:Acyl-CoA synthetase n=2 Tax=Aliidongia dinghuensis TaxID=1867774 RepID=A0A8J2Z0J6_9PROT|nr:acyl-CoA synthetase [Aliidongia dinghuensis]